MGLGFSTLCRIHAGIDLLSGAAMVLNLDATAKAAHGEEIATSLLKSDLVRTSESLVGVLLVDFALLLGAVSTVKDEKFQRVFCGVALCTHGLMAAWRIFVESRVPELQSAWKNQLVGDALMASTWAYFLLQKAKAA